MKNPHRLPELKFKLNFFFFQLRLKSPYALRIVYKNQKTEKIGDCVYRSIDLGRF